MTWKREKNALFKEKQGEMEFLIRVEMQYSRKIWYWSAALKRHINFSSYFKFILIWFRKKKYLHIKFFFFFLRTWMFCMSGWCDGGGGVNFQESGEGWGSHEARDGREGLGWNHYNSVMFFHLSVTAFIVPTIYHLFWSNFLGRFFNFFFFFLHEIL